VKVAIYCRLSEEDKNKQTKTDDSESIQNQKKMLIEFSLENGWSIYDIYSDDDFKGSDRNRPEFNRLLLDAEKRKFDIVLCKSQSRFTRELVL
jgi:DNA invertase Pin-like site-specific DNA recombinase